MILIVIIDKCKHCDHYKLVHDEADEWYRCDLGYETFQQCISKILDKFEAKDDE